MAKVISLGSKAKEKLMEGVNILANAVASTMGPQGSFVVIEKPYDDPYITKDGVTVAREIELSDPQQNMGCSIMQQAASTTLDSVGDGTTTAVVLTRAILKNGYKFLEDAGNAVSLKKGLNSALTKAKEMLIAIARPVNQDSPELLSVATISANNDVELGKIITEAVNYAGKDGLVLVENSKNPTTTVEFMGGINFDRGYMSEHFVTDTSRMVVKFEKPLLLFVDENIRAIQDLIPVLEACNSNGVKEPLVIFADDVIEQAINQLVMNKMQAGLEVAVVRAPSFGDHRKDLMKDMAIATGATYLSESEGTTLSSLAGVDQAVILSYLGDCDSISIAKNSTTIMGAKGDQDEIDIRINTIKAQLEDATIPQYESQMKQRIAKLQDGIAVIRVGAATEMEMREKRDRVDDAVCATQAALEQGIVCGGGLSLVTVGAEMLDDASVEEKVLIHSMMVPINVILENAGRSPEDVPKVLDENIGYNALEDRWENMYEAGIVDPLKVTLTALETAVSVASTILTTNVLITIDPEHKPTEIEPSVNMF